MVTGLSETTRSLPSLLTEKEVAALLKVSLAALRRWRSERSGPAYVKLGTCVRYAPDIVRQWIDQQTVGERSC